MAYVTKLFMGFEEFAYGYNSHADGSFAGFGGQSAGGYSPYWDGWAKPPHVYHRNGVATLNAAENGSTAGGIACHFNNDGRVTTVLTETYKTGGALGNSTGYTQWTGSNRTLLINSTTGGMQIAIDRDYWIGTNATEIYAQWDFQLSQTTTGSQGVTVTNGIFVNPTAMFVWGDVAIHIKSQTYVSTPSAMYTLVLAVYNNGSEIATISLPQQAAANWYYCRAHIKLDGAAGVIEFECNTTTMSVPFAAGNTINTVSVANADWIYIGPPFADTGTTSYLGATDNFWLGTTGWPTGRPRGFPHTVASDGTLSGWAAEGTSATTITDALLGNDAKAARGSGSGATALLNLTGIATTGLESDLIGYTIIPAYISNRDQTTWKRLSVGMSSGGTHTMGALTSAQQPPLAYRSTPPAEVYIQYSWEGLYLDSGGTPFPSSSLHSVRLLTI